MENTSKPEEILVRVLEIINFTDDKDAFVKKFLENCQKMALQQAIQDLSEDERVKVDSISELPPNQNSIDQLRQLIPEDKYLQKLEVATASLFEEYIMEIYPELNEDQKNDLETYLNSLQ